MPKTDSEKKPAEKPEEASAKSDFSGTRLHSALARFTTSRWSKFFGYGVLIVACRAIRILIRA